jgi:hypothetical protein
VSCDPGDEGRNLLRIPRLTILQSDDGACEGFLRGLVGSLDGAESAKRHQSQAGAEALELLDA